MKLVIAYIRPESLTDVKQALYAKQFYGMSVTNILGSGRQKGFTETYRGVVMEVNLLKKVRLELAVSEAKVDDAVQAIMGAAKTGREGDGVILVQDVEQSYRVRTGEENLS
ncbi:P-II family nitrogen regulator [Oceanidesulfovibrio marinus]|uniref:P-II family nitrogen regulator n=1 Tax=Oceanidesulfovibrio marinus TaxID=370038 RepID=A0A6P1ZLM6_9BACT|nr:P-II family nitrogen regulator [Oceanidesulfovibrio marinus]QJT09864.1 P-II family nitrogen regulator [Oceanidesulfovibrio marinus]TVM36019.1 transcriptional regulator [Oceanidesulfovibrio marinus]